MCSCSGVYTKFGFMAHFQSTHLQRITWLSQSDEIAHKMRNPMNYHRIGSFTRFH